MTPENATKLQAQLERHEGKRNNKYVDTLGNVTWGVGHEQQKNENPVFPLTDEEVYEILDNDTANAYSQCSTHLSFFDALDEIRQAVLVNMTFNIGIGELLQ